jgi:hypothetical protein
MNWAKGITPSSRQLEKSSAFWAYLAFGILLIFLAFGISPRR